MKMTADPNRGLATLVALICTAVPLICSAADCATTPGFAAARSYPVNDDLRPAPASVGVGDFNGDGKPDLAVALDRTSSTQPGGVAILLNNGDGTFGSGTNYAPGSGYSYQSVAIEDFNGDSRLDLAVTDSTSTNVAIVLGTGTGTFGPTTNFTVGANPSSVTAGDFNHDGKADLAVANSSSGSVSVLFGTGGGSFQTAVDYPVGPSLSAVATGEFNGDSRPDLAVTSVGSTNISILTNNGSGIFLVATNYLTGANPNSIGTGDFNVDGKLDLAVANLGLMDSSYPWHTNGSLSIYLGRGDGTFQVASNYFKDSPIGSVSVGDFDDDNKPDLATAGGEWLPGRANSNSQEISVFLGNGDGSFSAATNYTAGFNPMFVAVGDFDADGRSDLAIANNDQNLTGNVAVLLGNGDGTFPAPVWYPATGIKMVGRSAIGDFNRDGKRDVVVPYYNGESDISVLIGKGDGSFLTRTNYFVGREPLAVGTGDFNGDGKLDVAAAGSFDAVSVLLGHGDGSFQPAANYPIASIGEAITVGDFNRDQKLDLVVATVTSGRSATVLIGNGDGTFQSPSDYPAGGYGYDVVVADFNADGRSDLAVANMSAVSVLFGNGDGTFQPPVSYSVGNYLWSLAVGDFNGDHSPDLVAANHYPGAGVVVLLNSGNGTFPTVIDYPVSAVVNCAGVGDFNGDGRADLVAGGNQGMAILLGRGDGTFLKPVSFGASRRGSAPSYCAAADFNGDGAVDVLLAAIGVSVLLNTCPAAPPSLAITSDDSSSVVSWPFPSTGFGLQSISSLASTNWQSVAEAPATNNMFFEVTVPSGAPQRYFRLLKP